MHGVLPGFSSLPVPGMIRESGAPAAMAKEDAEKGFVEASSTPGHSPCRFQDGISSPGSSPDKDWTAGWGLPSVAAERIFLDAEAMKDKVRQALHKPTYNVANFYKETGLWQQIARSSKFENVVLSVISINALWISIDTEWNDAKVLNTAHVVFQFAEHFFCAFFFLEWFVRFMAFERKRNGLKDAWFLFDSVMMCMMVLETWVMSFYIYTTGSSTAIAGGNSSALRLLRILRLSRVARVAKLLRALPDLMILLKGLLAAVRSVFFTFCLLLLIIYVFAIAIKQLTAETRIGSRYFSGVATSMYTLFVRGALLDEVSGLLDDCFEESPMVGTLLIVFIVAASVTVMNMLIGVLCQVVTTVAEVEKEEMTVAVFEGKLRAVAARLDKDDNGTISRDEFCSLLGDGAACKALQDVGVDPVGLIDYVDIIFEAEEGRYDRTLSFGEFVEVVLDLRGSSTATVKDIVDLRKYTRNVLQRTTVRMDQGNIRLARIEEGMNMLLGADSPCKREGRRRTRQSQRRGSSKASSSDIADEVDVPSPSPSISPSLSPTRSSTREHCITESTALVGLMETLDKALNARISDLQRLMRDVAQDMHSSISASESIPMSPGPSPRAAQGADASSSVQDKRSGISALEALSFAPSPWAAQGADASSLVQGKRSGISAPEAFPVSPGPSPRATQGADSSSLVQDERSGISAPDTSPVSLFRAPWAAQGADSSSLVQNMRSGISAPEAFPVSPGPSPWAAQGADPSSSVQDMRSGISAPDTSPVSLFRAPWAAQGADSSSLVQDIRSGISAPESFPVSPGPSPWAAQGADASSSHASSHATPARSSLATLPPVSPEGMKLDSDNVASPHGTLRLSSLSCGSRREPRAEVASICLGSLVAPLTVASSQQVGAAKEN